VCAVFKGVGGSAGAVLRGGGPGSASTPDGREGCHWRGATGGTSSMSNEYELQRDTPHASSRRGGMSRSCSICQRATADLAFNPLTCPRTAVQTPTLLRDALHPLAPERLPRN
jgi:hypothetical protein